MTSSVLGAKGNERSGAREGNGEGRGEQRRLNGFDRHVTDGLHHALEDSSCIWGTHGKTISLSQDTTVVP